MPGEPVFAPAADATAEDDGYLMTFVHDAETDTSRFVVLDAAIDGRHADRVGRAAPHPARVPRQLDPGVGGRLTRRARAARMTR